MYTHYALFEDEKNVDSAIRTIESIGAPLNRCTISVHKEPLDARPSSEAPLFETAAASTLVRGTVIGGVLGTLAGALLLGPLGIAIGRFTGAVFGLFTGAMSGAYVGSIAGAADLDPEFKRMSDEIANGKILVAVDAPSIDAADRVDTILTRNGGRVVHRRFLRTGRRHTVPA